MHKAAALIAISALVSVSVAVPVAQGNWADHQPNSAAPPSPACPSSPSGNCFPLANGFPNLNAAALNAVEVVAQGTEPNGPAPTGLSGDDLTSFRLIAFNELFEVAFFTDLLCNITSNVPGFTFDDDNTKQQVVTALTAIQAQEELHAINANAILQANGQAPIQACQYQFPSSDLEGALAFAQTFTDVVLGTLQDVQLHLATNNANGVVPVIGSVIGQEGEQNGFFRLFNGKIPSAQPFLTRSSREFAYSALNQAVVVPGSCPNANLIDLPIFTPLTVVTAPIAPKDQSLQFSIPASANQVHSGVSIVYINGQNVPIVEPVNKVVVSNGVATFEAVFPYAENLLNGLTIAAFVNGNGPFASAEDVAKATIAGPGLIEIM